jgi:deoxyribose-phosphate aldolase
MHDADASDRDLASRIDHTLLKPEATGEDVDRLVDDALRFGFASVCVNGYHLARVVGRLTQHQARPSPTPPTSGRGSEISPLPRSGRGEGEGASPHLVRACAVASFPLGATTPFARAAECTNLAKIGAHEIDLVAFLPHLLAKDADALASDLIESVRQIRAVSRTIVVKVILETGALRAAANDDADFESMIVAGCDGARRSGCDFVKTSTGFHSAGGATVDAVRLMAKHANGLKIKASGGIRTRDDALRMLDAGADRLGCSSGVAIVSGSGPRAASPSSY